MEFRRYHWGPNETWKISRELQAERVFTRIPIDNSSMSNGQDLEMIKYITQSDLPTFIPCKLMFPSKTPSTLTKAAQASCRNALSLSQAGYDKNRLNESQQRDLKIYTQLQNKIIEENNAFLRCAEEEWATKGKRINILCKPLRKYAYKMWRRKEALLHNYPQFYKLCKNAISLSPGDYKVDVARIQEILRLGSVAEFSKPSLLVKCVLDLSALPMPEQQTYNSKLPVSQDANISNIVKNHNIDIVISSSSMKTFMDNSDYRIAWNVPVIVKLVEQKQPDGTFITKTVVYIDKTLPKKRPDTINFNEYCHKKLVKTNFCRYHGFSYSNSEQKIDDPNYKAESSQKESESTGSPPNVTIHHNAAYDMWKMKLNHEGNHLMKTRMSGKELNFLIRYKVDGCELVNDIETRSVTILPKLELQLELGANIATKQEVIREWTSLFFRPFSHLYRIRLQSNSSEVVSVESVNLQKLNFEAMQHYQYKPNDQLIVVYKVFLELSKLEPGNYLLHHTERNGPFAQIMKEEKVESIYKKKLNIYDLYSDYKTNTRIPLQSTKPWCPIDVNYILPIHTVYKRLPGTFQPVQTQFKKKKNRGRNKKKKKNNKNKKNNVNKEAAAAAAVATAAATKECKYI
ncbi:hypothetical protein ILUMI_25885 [Ignelater luminosus]|uniref:Little elongation complex subunit 2 C-terminal domain-containing protein n=1 Tax=Ignelater luminosus TaxID=2038154 RepID=A0A8K0FZM6_IGNLU|nr:hypothetical protein ILUMI_25885 [Ignelater luminosus]